MGSILGAVALVLLPMPRTLRYRLRLRAPVVSRRADRLADATLPVMLLAILALVVAAAWPRPPGGLPRLWPAGAALGLATGVPFAVERRGLRRRVAGVPPLDEPAAHGPHTGSVEGPAATAVEAGDVVLALEMLEPLLEGRPTPEALRLRALLAARGGDVRAARLHALHAAHVDPHRWDALLDVGIALCRRGRFAEGARLLERGVELSGRSPAALETLAAGRAAAGRLHEAAAALDEAEGVSAGPAR
jgi:tetratricopeptide (TPR) repeat protein